MYQYPLKPNEIYHYGIKRRSGRYPYGSGNRPYQDVERARKKNQYQDVSKVSISRKKLSENTQLKLTDEVLKKYKDQYKNLSHVKIDNTTNGFLYEKNGKVVAMINTEKKPDGKIWIQGLEVYGDNKGTGLSRGLLDVAVTDLKATNLSVRKTNKVAKKLYEDYGFETYESSDFMDFMSIDNLKHSEIEVKFKMNNIYYLSHGGPGSGRYPLGSGDRPYQKFEGSRRRSSGISGYISAKKKEKERALEAKKKKEKEQRGVDKERVLKSGTPSEVSKYRGELTRQELQDVYSRLNFERMISDMSKKDNMEIVEKIIRNVKKTTGWVAEGAVAYNIIASTYNNFVDESKRLPILRITR